MEYKELQATSNKINSWYEKKNKVLSLKSRPFNTELIFLDVLKNCLNKKNKVLYVICNNEKNIINKIKLNFQKELSLQSEEEIKFISINDIENEKELFDLVIFDDISIFSEVSKKRLLNKIQNIYWNSIKIIVYSIEFIFPIGEKIEIPYLINKKPMIEPRIITTRLNLERDIPTILHEYYNWFKIKNRNVLILIPDEDKVDKVYSNYRKYFKKENINGVKFLKEDDPEVLKKAINKSLKGTFILTSIISEVIKEIKNLEIVVLFSDDNKYDYKKIIYLCGTLMFIEEVKIPEILCVSKEVSEDMDLSKSITRSFNAKLWK